MSHRSSDCLRWHLEVSVASITHSFTLSLLLHYFHSKNANSLSCGVDLMPSFPFTCFYLDKARYFLLHPCTFFSRHRPPLFGHQCIPLPSFAIYRLIVFKFCISSHWKVLPAFFLGYWVFYELFKHIHPHIWSYLTVMFFYVCRSRLCSTWVGIYMHTLPID